MMSLETSPSVESVKESDMTSYVVQDAIAGIRYLSFKIRCQASTGDNLPSQSTPKMNKKKASVLGVDHCSLEVVA